MPPLWMLMVFLTALFSIWASEKLCMNQSYFHPAESLTEQVSSVCLPSEMVFLSAVTVAVGLLADIFKNSFDLHYYYRYLKITASKGNG